MKRESTIKKELNTIKDAMKGMSIDELKEVNSMVVDEINYRSRLRDMEALRKFRTGMKVSFGNNRRGFFTGEVIKINQRSLTVKQTNSHVIWTVGPESCKIVTEEPVHGSA